MNLKRLADNFPDFGETFYVVDTNFRTQAQGWTKADKTGPLDLWEQRNEGHVFYGAGTTVGSAYATDNAAIQAAIDAGVDYRGDKVLLLPGSYSIATALTVDCTGIRILGCNTG